MARTGIVLLLLAVYFLSPIFADNLTCQYRITENVSKEGNIFYYKGIQLNSPLLTVNDTKSFGNINNTLNKWTYEFKVYSSYLEYIEVTVGYVVDGSQKYVNLSIAPREYEIVFGKWGGAGPNFNSIRFNVTYPDGITVKRENATQMVESCRNCSGKICLNDNEPCNKSSECGSGLCMVGYCLNNETCHNARCNCSTDEIRCSDNPACVKISSVPIGSKPKCNLSRECNTGYINATTGLCDLPSVEAQKAEAKNEFQEIAEETSDQSHENSGEPLSPAGELNVSEENKTYLAIGIAGGIILISIIIFLRNYFRDNSEKNSQKTLQNGRYWIKETTESLEKKKKEPA